MSVRGSRFARPVAPGAADAHTVGWWAMLLGIVALAYFVGAIIVAYLYLRAGYAQWPPEGFAPPDLVIPAVAVGLTALAALFAHLEVGWTAERGTFGMLGAVGAIIVGTGAIILRAWSLLGFEVRWDEHAYGSLHWLLAGTDILLVLSGVIGSAAVLAQHAMGDYDTERHDEIKVLSLYWWFVVAASVALYVVGHLVPRM